MNIVGTILDCSIYIDVCQRNMPQSETEQVKGKLFEIK